MEQVVLVGLLALSWWLATLGALLVSGAFPLEQRPRPLRTGTGTLSVLALAVAAALLAVASVSRVLGYSSWPYAVLGAGLGSVLAPPCFAWLPDTLVDRPLGAAVFSVGCAAALGGWLSLGEG